MTEKTGIWYGRYLHSQKVLAPLPRSARGSTLETIAFKLNRCLWISLFYCSTLWEGCIVSYWLILISYPQDLPLSN